MVIVETSTNLAFLEVISFTRVFLNRQFEESKCKEYGRGFNKIIILQIFTIFIYIISILGVQFIKQAQFLT